MGAGSMDVRIDACVEWRGGVDGPVMAVVCVCGEWPMRIHPFRFSVRWRFIRFRSGLWRVSGFSFLFVLRLGPNAIKYYISRGRVSCLYLRIVRMLPFRVFSL